MTLLWIVVATGTIKKAVTGEIFFAPCLKDVEGMEEQEARHFGETMCGETMNSSDVCYS